MCPQSVGTNSMFSSTILLQRVCPSLRLSSRQTCAFCMSGGPLPVKCLLAVPLYVHIWGWACSCTTYSSQYVVSTNIIKLRSHVYQKIFICKFHLLSVHMHFNMLLTLSDSASTVCAWIFCLVPTQVCALIARCIFQRLPAERFEVWAIERLPKVCFGIY